MNRSNYSELDDQWEMIRWRGAVASAVRGRRGQAFLKELLEALDSLPEKKLIEGALIDCQGQVCALGGVGVKRGIDLTSLDIYDSEKLANLFGVAEALIKELEHVNDSAWVFCKGITPEERFNQVREWCVTHLETSK